MEEQIYSFLFLFNLTVQINYRFRASRIKMAAIVFARGKLVTCAIVLNCLLDGDICFSPLFCSHNFSIAGPLVDHFGFYTLPDLQEYYSSYILGSDLTQIFFFPTKKNYFE